MSGTAERSLSLRLPEPFHHWRLLEADSLNITKTVFVFIKGLWGRQAQNNVVVTTYKKQEKVHACTALDSLNLYCQNGNKMQPFVLREGGGKKKKLNKVLCLSSVSAPRWHWEATWLAVAQTHREDAFLGWPLAMCGLRCPTLWSPLVSAHSSSSESCLKTTVSEVLCNGGVGCEGKREGQRRGKMRGGCWRLSIQTKSGTVSDLSRASVLPNSVNKVPQCSVGLI